MKKTDIKDIKPIFALGMILLVLAAFSTLFLEPGEETVTGQATTVKYWGSSNYPYGGQFAGDIQTEVRICQPDLANLYAAGTVIKVADKITSAADFGNSLASAAQLNAPTPIPTNMLDAVISGSRMATTKFKDETACLSSIGQKYQYQECVDLVMITRPMWKKCWYYTEWHSLHARHLFYEKNSKKYICDQVSPALMSMETMTGKTSRSTYGC